MEHDLTPLETFNCYFRKCDYVFMHITPPRLVVMFVRAEPA